MQRPNSLAAALGSATAVALTVAIGFLLTIGGCMKTANIREDDTNWRTPVAKSSAPVQLYAPETESVGLGDDLEDD